MLTDPMSLERLLTAGILATLAIVVAFGPELSRALWRMRNRRAADPVVVQESQNLSVEAQRS